MFNQTTSLAQLGWRPFYSQQLTLEDLYDGFPARVAAVQRSLFTVLAESGGHQVSLPQRLRPDGATSGMTVGDWVLVRSRTLQFVRLLDRQSLIARMAAGTESVRQPIAANVDTLFVVTACDAGFSPSRLERYLAVAHEARVTPVITLTKVDTCADSQPYLEVASRASRDVAVVALLGTGTQRTREVRQADQKGRHTTTTRYLLPAPCGALLIDTPGMRELKIGAARAGVARTFVDIDSLATACQFRDCSHRLEAGCAVRSAVEDGRLDARRLESYLKLAREAARAASTPWQRHQETRRFGRMARAAQKRRRQDTGREE